MTNLQPIAITMGDPSGVGPEIICKVLREMSDAERAATIVIGGPTFLERANDLLGTGLSFGPAFDDLAPGTVRVVAVETENSDQVRPGTVSAAGGEIAYQSVVEAVKLTSAGKVAVIVTAPLNKEAMHKAGHHFDGHTGLLAHLTGAKSSFMLLASEELASVHVTTHLSMRDATERITRDRVLATIRAGHQHFQELGHSQPRIAVAGLNPHCGEGGIFGREEIDHIAPAVGAAQAEGINVVGPIPGDTVYHRTVKGEFDLVIAQYHDQGHAPAKLLAFDTTVNISLGLPIRRTSVDHGTAFDIAWQGKADHVNLQCAIAYGRRWAKVEDKAATMES